MLTNLIQHDDPACLSSLLQPGSVPCLPLTLIAPPSTPRSCLSSLYLSSTSLSSPLACFMLSQSIHNFITVYYVSCSHFLDTPPSYQSKILLNSFTCISFKISHSSLFPLISLSHHTHSLRLNTLTSLISRGKGIVKRPLKSFPN